MLSVLLRRCRPASCTKVNPATVRFYTATTCPTDTSPRLCPRHFSQLAFAVEIVFTLLLYLSPGSSPNLTAHRRVLHVLLSLQNIFIPVYFETP